MGAAGIIFSNIHDKNIPELTRFRTVASVPFLCRYRLVDFPLSNMVNSDIYNIGIITHSNYHSLMDHIGSGKDFDLARRDGGIRVLPPYVTAFAGGDRLYSTRLEALISVYPFISGIREDVCVLSDCDTVCNINIGNIIAEHRACGADITAAVSDGSRHTGSGPAVLYRTDDKHRVRDITEGVAESAPGALSGLNLFIIRTELLSFLVADAAAHGYKSFTRDIMLKGIDRYKIMAYTVSGYSASFTSVTDYFNATMELVHDKSARDELFMQNDRPIYTRTKNSAPTMYGHSARVSDSLIADGCDIRGTVDGSVLFRGVKIGDGASVRNSIIMQGCIIGDGAKLDHVICDKNAVIRDGRSLSGCDGTPFYIPKGHMA